MEFCWPSCLTGSDILNSYQPLCPVPSVQTANSSICLILTVFPTLYLQKRRLSTAVCLLTASLTVRTQTPLSGCASDVLSVRLLPSQSLAQGVVLGLVFWPLGFALANTHFDSPRVTVSKEQVILSLRQVLRSSTKQVKTVQETLVFSPDPPESVWQRVLVR